MTADEMCERNLSELYQRTPKTPLRPEDRYVVASDLHMGNGGSADDFKSNADLFATVMRDHYLSGGFKLILNGDIEELQRFSLESIRRRWAEVYEIFSRFEQETGLHRLVGNHDIELWTDAPEDFRVAEAIRLDYHGDDIFIFHGHQTSPRILRHGRLIGFVLRYIATPLRLRNREVSRHSEKQFRTERRVYSFASDRKILAVIGHTHRPLFESMSKVDSLKFEIERLIRKYPKSGDKKKRKIEAAIESHKRELLRMQQLNGHHRDDERESLYNENLVVPTLFNSGCVIGKRGMTVLEINGAGQLSLVHWFDRRRSRKYLEYSTYETSQLADTDYFRVEIQSDSLDYVLSRVKLLA
jgi:UDP-2,3-diacylglucosamine pyrophosphatase LpxH